MTNERLIIKPHVNSGVEQLIDGFAPLEMLFYDRRYMAWLDSAIPDLVWGDSHRRTRAALAHATAALNGGSRG